MGVLRRIEIGCKLVKVNGDQGRLKKARERSLILKWGEL